MDPNTTRLAIHWEHLHSKVEDFLVAAGEPIIIIAPFIDPEVLAKLVTLHPISTVITSWRPDHLRDGVSSLETYPLVKGFGGQLIINDRLHAKIITENFDHSLVGSANVTRPGLGLGPRPNLEVMVEIDRPTPELRGMFSHVMIHGRVVTDDIYERYKLWLETQPPSFPNGWSEDNFLADPSDPFLLAMLPASQSPRVLWEVVNLKENLTSEAIHDIQLLGIDLRGPRREVYERITNALEVNPFFRFLLEEIKRHPDGLRFGALKELIQKNCVDTPMPHRRELTDLTQNLYNWFSELYQNSIAIRRPHHSQIIFPLK